MANENEIDYQSLEVDKENSTVSYNDKLHKYWTKDTHQSCISVTTLINRFDNFDEEFWSSYKALQAVAGEETFSKVKKQLLDTKIINGSHIELCGVSMEDFQNKREEILKEWAAKRDESCIRGTLIHREHELGHLGGETPEVKKLGLGGKFTPNVTNKIELGSQKVYPEILLSWMSEDGELRIAGQADLIIIDGTSLYVLDYKTNKSIDKKSYFDTRAKRSTMMKYPLNNLQDSNFWHYSLQLSTYAWMIKQAYPEVEIKKLMLIHYDHNGNCTDYECDYLEAEVIRMLSFYKKELEYDKFKNKRKKIQY